MKLAGKEALSTAETKSIHRSMELEQQKVQNLLTTPEPIHDVQLQLVGCEQEKDDEGKKRSLNISPTKPPKRIRTQVAVTVPVTTVDIAKRDSFATWALAKIGNNGYLTSCGLMKPTLQCMGTSTYSRRATSNPLEYIMHCIHPM
ncbi:hypothetical protein AVEN_74555-1 [Araneus ventricosus]|uniref:Uncharacterized protein n=1 Tax=Araneus ventricosus TaxID=182803 RepID=A0A4Y2R8N9_ARAVE|nr:hypothetical protein AVEN_224845-1 [Araneus ventricosus]GBN72083.1 hypothetical protein AVEN_74555-1 [Araneus ventricosus]